MIPLQENIAPPPTKQQLLATLKDCLKDLVTDEINGEMEPERLWTLKQSRKSDLYWRGIQYVSPYLFDNGSVDFSGVSGVPLASTGDGKDGSMGLYDYNQNIYRGFGRKFAAVLGQRSPNVKAVADDPQDEQAKIATRNADNAAAILHSKWNVEVRNMELAMYLWKSGTAFAYTPFIKDGRKYGVSTEPKLEAREVPTGPATWSCKNCGAETPESQPGVAPQSCPNCRAPYGPEDYREPNTVSVPVPVGVAQYENGAVELELLNSMFVVTGFYNRSLEEAPWISYDYDAHKGKLIQKYPELRDSNLDNQGPDTSSTTAAQMTRDSAASPMGIPVPHRASRWNYRRVWIRPEMYECVKDDGNRKLLLDNFRTGLKITMVQGRVMELEEEDLSDVWAECQPETGEFIYRDGIGFDMLSVQDIVNDCGVNIPAETIERGLGITFADPRVIDVDQWNKKAAKAAEVIPVLTAVGQTLGDSFYQMPPAAFSGQIESWSGSMQSMGMQVVGVVPEIFGGGDADTARQAEINKNAALMQLGTTWLYVRKFWEKVYLNGVKQMAKWGSGTVQHGTMTVDLAELAAGGYHFEADEAMPMTWAQRRDFIMWLLEKPPELLQAYGVTHPQNVRNNQALLGMTGYYTPNSDLLDKTLETIQQLSQQAPVQQQGQDGSMQLQPSIPADEFEDDHAFVVQAVQAWCTSATGRKVRETSPDGYANVVAFGKAHAQMAAPPPPAPPPPQPPKITFSGKLPLDAQQSQQILQEQGINVPAPIPPLTNAHGQVAPAPVAPPPAPAGFRGSRFAGSALPAPGLSGMPARHLPGQGPLIPPGGPPPPTANPLTGLAGT